MPGLHQLGAAVATMTELYRNHRGNDPTASEELAWSKDIEAKLARGDDLTPTYEFIAWALDNPTAAAKI